MKLKFTHLGAAVFSFSLALMVSCGANNEKSSATNALDYATDGSAQDYSQTAFILTQDLSFSSIGENVEGENIVRLEAGSEIAILEKLDDAKLGRLVRIGIDRDEGSDLPTEYWVRQKDLPDSAMENYFPSEEEEIFQAAKKRMTYCFRYVKQYLLSTGKVKVYLPGTSAYQAASILPRYGFRRTGHGPANAVNGEVCVYAGGPAGHGHIEVKRNGGWWYGYGVKPRPIANRRFLSCFIK